MGLIRLTQGRFAIVDDDNVQSLSQFKWFYMTVGYAARHTLPQTRKNQKMIYMHRQILAAPAGVQVDHINHDKLDNRRENLRLCSRPENRRNQKVRSDCLSQYKGVHWRKDMRCWYIRISTLDGVKRLGTFKDVTKAAKTYDLLARYYYGDFAETNFLGSEKASFEEVRNHHKALTK